MEAVKQSGRLNKKQRRRANIWIVEDLFREFPTRRVSVKAKGAFGKIVLEEFYKRFGFYPKKCYKIKVRVMQKSFKNRPPKPVTKVIKVCMYPNHNEQFRLFKQECRVFLQEEFLKS